jgi:surface antigen
MYQQAGVFFYRFRYLLASILTAAFLVLISAVVTAVGNGTVLAHPSTDTSASIPSYSPNVVTEGASALSGGTQHALISAGGGLYQACKSVTIASAVTGRATVHGSAVALDGIWHGTTFVGRGVGDGVMFSLRTAGEGIMYTVRAPGRIVGSLTSGRTVSDVIRPSDTDKQSVPVISAETSAAALASFNAAEQQEIAKLQAAQLADNQSLDGVVVAGNATHGGYPAKWDDARQDSMLDSWGMYNRECVSYTAWKVYQTFGTMPYWGGVGNANQWVGDAIRAGTPTGTTPKVHAVAIWRVGYYGHAMWVEAVNGNMIYVSQYNYDLNGRYSEMWVNGSRFTYIYFK